MDVLPGCAQGQGGGQRSRDMDTFLMSGKPLLLTVKWLKISHNDPHVGLHQRCAHVQDQRSRGTTGIMQPFACEKKRFLWNSKCAGTTWPLILNESTACILTKLSLSLTSPSLCPFGFLLHCIPIHKWLWVCAVSSAIACMVKQFVKLFALQYGLTFCLYVRPLYEAPLHSPARLSNRQLDLISKSWNELLRHCRMISVF